MPEKQTIERAHRDAAQGKSTSTQAGEFVREQIHHIRQGRHGARSAKQAIAIGLSEARRAGVKLPPPKAGSVSAGTRKKAEQDAKRGRGPAVSPSPKRSKATLKALRREPREAASKTALGRHARAAARSHTAGERSEAARKAAATRHRVA